MKQKKQTILCLFMALSLLIVGLPQTHIEARSNTIEVTGELELDSNATQETSPTKPNTDDPKESVTPSAPPKKNVLPPLGEQIQVLYVLTGVILILIVLVSYQIIRDKRRNPKKMGKIIVNYSSKK